MKSAAARHSSNTTAGALQYITLDMGIAAREQQQQQQAETDTQRHKQRQQHAVTKERFAEPTSIIRRMTVAMDLLLVIQDILAEPCSRIITEQTVFKRLLAFQADAIMAIGLSISGGSASDSCGCLLSHALGVTLIDVEGGGLWTGPPSVPQFGTGLTPADLKSWHGYTLNLVTWTLRQSMPLISHFWGPGSWKRVRDRLGLPRASSDSPLADALERVRGTKVRKCEALMGVILGSWLLEYPRALAAHQVIVGPGTPRTPHPITSPTDVADFANTAYDGLILVAFGTSYQYNSWLSPQDFIELAHAFAALAPVRVLWNLNSQGLPQGLQLQDLQISDNINIVPWVDYNDVLGHRNMRLIVSHCGLHSMYETLFHGVPVLGVPFIFEHVENCCKLAVRGAAVLSPQSPAYRAINSSIHYTRQHIEELATQVLQDAAYTRAAKAMSTALQTYAKRRHPYARAADEIELAVLTLHAQQEKQQQQQVVQTGHSDQHGGHDGHQGGRVVSDEL
eukprot:GHUV01021845.1.p1 GENE.GHUV01021845.1~~GHUV01021845.1.p1  ORF type:complete len:508 (+),score=124.81 GHUV01021845.1:392-1915(+)